jgi:GNAT superfamily N-acetyltransferase
VTPAFEKESWVSATLLDWGSCGKVVYVDGVPGRLRHVRPAGVRPALGRLPDLAGQRRRGAAHDRHVHPDFAGGGLGRMLLQGVAKDLTARGVRAIEAFGDERWERPAVRPAGEHLRSVGFKTVRPHHRFPRLRPGAEVGGVLARGRRRSRSSGLLGSMSPDPLLRPV